MHLTISFIYLFIFKPCISCIKIEKERLKKKKRMKPVCVLGVCLSFAEENDAVKRGTLIRWEKNRE